MKKNVKKPSATKKRSSQKRGKAKPSYGLWGSIAGVCLLLVGGIWYVSTETSLHALLAHFHSQPSSTKVAHQSSSAKKTAVTENDASTEPEFDFYQMLPSSKVETTVQNTKEIDKTTVQNTTPILQESPEGAPIENMTSPVTTAENPPPCRRKRNIKAG